MFFLWGLEGGVYIHSTDRTLGGFSVAILTHCSVLAICIGVLTPAPC